VRRSTSIFPAGGGSSGFELDKKFSYAIVSDSFVMSDEVSGHKSLGVALIARGGDKQGPIIYLMGKTPT
jgi:hypothetical protein